MLPGIFYACPPLSRQCICLFAGAYPAGNDVLCTVRVIVSAMYTIYERILWQIRQLTCGKKHGIV